MLVKMGEHLPQGSRGENEPKIFELPPPIYHPWTRQLLVYQPRFQGTASLNDDNHQIDKGQNDETSQWRLENKVFQGALLEVGHHL